MIPTMRLAVFSVLVVAATFVVVACAGDDAADSNDEELSAEGYFERLGTLANLDEAIAGAYDELGPPPEGPERDEWSEEYYLSGYGALVEAYEVLIGELEDMRPPEGLNDAHDEYIGATRAMAEALAEVLAGLDTADSLDEMNEIIRELLDEELTLQQLDACRGLQQAADDTGVTFDAECPQSHPFEEGL